MANSRVGIVGLGIMGSAMAANLLRARFTVIGYDPVAACRARHRKAGGIVAASAIDVARQARILISSLPSATALSQVAGELSSMRKSGNIIVETSTLEIPVRHRPRVAGVSKYGVWNRLGRGLHDLIGLAWYQKRRLRPVAFQELESPAPRG